MKWSYPSVMLIASGCVLSGLAGPQRSAECETKLGIENYTASRAKEAIPHLRAALKLSPSSSEARTYLGLSLAQTGACPEALSYLKNARRATT
jgi:Flp pilus assembly protein TadD